MWNLANQPLRKLAIAEPLIDLGVFRESLDVQSGDHVLGSATPLEALLSTLLDDPARITLCVGFPEARSRAAFQLAAVRVLDAEEYAQLQGWRSGTYEVRRTLLERVRQELPPADRETVDVSNAALEAGLLHDTNARRLLAELLARFGSKMNAADLDGFLGITPMTTERRRELFTTWRLSNRWFWTRRCLAIRYTPRRFLRKVLGLRIASTPRFLRRSVENLLDALEHQMFQGLASHPIFEHALTGRVPKAYDEHFLGRAAYDVIRARLDRVHLVPHVLFEGGCSAPFEGRVDRLFLGIGPFLEQPVRKQELARRCSQLLRPQGRVLALPLIPRDPLRDIEGLVSLERESFLSTTRESTGIYPLVSIHRARSPHESRRPTSERLLSML